MKTDLKKEMRSLYAPPPDPVLVDVPPMRFLMVDGTDAPGAAGYTDAISALYSLGKGGAGLRVAVGWAALTWLAALALFLGGVGSEAMGIAFVPVWAASAIDTAPQAPASAPGGSSWAMPGTSCSRASSDVARSRPSSSSIGCRKVVPA